MTSPKFALLGSGGLLGRHVQELAAENGIDLQAAPRAAVDAQDPAAVRAWLSRVAPDVVIVNAAHTGGVQANLASPATMLADNARVALAGIGEACALGVTRLLYCGSGIVYPADAPQPYRETDAGTGAMDPTHLGYAAAKYLGMQYCEAVRQQHGLAYTALLLGNMYGPGQRWEPARSNVVAGLMRRLHEAKISGAAQVEVWGTGLAKRDVLYARDAAAAVLTIAAAPTLDHALINVASGAEVTIA
ncbi:MAG: NAD-dependent epimerase/dehydratase family protein, partial [Caulobacterales bacterium]